MLISSTIIYFGDNPVGYDLFKEENIFLFKPTPATSSNLIPPVIEAKPVNEAWDISGTTNDDIKTQVLKLIDINKLIDMEGKLTAAT